MNEQELFKRIADTDGLPKKWRIIESRTIELNGATEPRQVHSRQLFYYDDEHWALFGNVKDGGRAAYPVDTIIVHPDVPAWILHPFSLLGVKLALEQF